MLLRLLIRQSEALHPLRQLRRQRLPRPGCGSAHRRRGHAQAQAQGGGHACLLQQQPLNTNMSSYPVTFTVDAHKKRCVAALESQLQRQGHLFKPSVHCAA